MKGVYDPGTANGWKNSIKAVFMDRAGQAVEGPLRVETTFYFPRPKSHYGTGKNSAKLKPSAPVYHVITPDIDNLEKAAYDALSMKIGVGFWKDDSQIVEAQPAKRFACGGPIGMRILIYALGQEEGR